MALVVLSTVQCTPIVTVIGAEQADHDDIVLQCNNLGKVPCILLKPASGIQHDVLGSVLLIVLS